MKLMINRAKSDYSTAYDLWELAFSLDAEQAPYQLLQRLTSPESLNAPNVSESATEAQLALAAQLGKELGIKRAREINRSAALFLGDTVAQMRFDGSESTLRDNLWQELESLLGDDEAILNDAFDAALASYWKNYPLKVAKWQPTAVAGREIAQRISNDVLERSDGDESLARNVTAFADQLNAAAIHQARDGGTFSALGLLTGMIADEEPIEELKTEATEKGIDPEEVAACALGVLARVYFQSDALDPEAQAAIKRINSDDLFGMPELSSTTEAHPITTDE